MPLGLPAVSEQTRDCQRQKKQWLSADNAGRTGLILATSTSSSVQWCVCVLLKRRLQHLSGQSPVVRLRAPHLPHSGVALQSNLAQHSFPSRRSRWQGYGSVGWSAETLNKLLKECRANTALLNMFRWTSRWWNLLLSRRNSSKSSPSTIGTI